jgi:hypothetical protein
MSVDPANALQQHVGHMAPGSDESWIAALLWFGENRQVGHAVSCPHRTPRDDLGYRGGLVTIRVNPRENLPCPADRLFNVHVKKAF